MQVKDYLQALQNEGKINVEKIGSGNWYWSFLSEEKKTRDDVLAKLQEEKEKLDSTVRDLEAKVEEAAAARGGEDDRVGLIAQREGLDEKVQRLKTELSKYENADPGEVDNKREETKLLMAKAEKWTDNIFVLEGWLSKVLGGDPEQMDRIRRECYGSEYVEGEGLPDL